MEVIDVWVFGGYLVGIRPDEGDEPAHVHISGGSLTGNAKVWFLQAGGILSGGKPDGLSDGEWYRLMRFISSNAMVFCMEWLGWYGRLNYYYC